MELDGVQFCRHRLPGKSTQDSIKSRVLGIPQYNQAIDSNAFPEDIFSNPKLLLGKAEAEPCSEVWNRMSLSMIGVNVWKNLPSNEWASHDTAYLGATWQEVTGLWGSSTCCSAYANHLQDCTCLL